MKWFSIESVCYFHSTVFFLHIVQRMSIQNQLSSEVNVSRESPGVRQQSIIQIAHLRNTHFIKSVWVLVFSSYICILFIVVIQVHNSISSLNPNAGSHVVMKHGLFEFKNFKNINCFRWYCDFDLYLDWVEDRYSLCGVYWLR